MSEKSDDNGIVWEEPPKRSAPTHRLLAPLMEHPGRWARLGERKSAAAATAWASHCRTGILRIPDGRWEFASSGPYIYARYLGPEDGA